MNQQHVAHGSAFRQNSSESRKVILDNLVVLPPCRVIVERRWIVALATATQCVEREMLTAQVDPQHILPIANPFLSFKSKFPARATIHFGDNLAAPELVRDACALLNRGKLVILFGEHVNAGNML